MNLSESNTQLPDTKGNTVANLLNKEENKDEKKVVEKEKQPELNYKDLYEKEVQRVKDNQKAFTEKATKLKRAESKLEVIQKNNFKSVDKFTKDQDLYLQSLLDSGDHESYFAERTKLTKEATDSINNQIDTLANEKVRASQKEGIEKFARENTHGITLEMLSLDLPMRVQNDYLSGKIGIEEFKVKATEHLIGPKHLRQVKVNKHANLDSVVGGSQLTPGNSGEGSDLYNQRI